MSLFRKSTSLRPPIPSFSRLPFFYPPLPPFSLPRPFILLFLPNYTRLWSLRFVASAKPLQKMRHAPLLCEYWPSRGWFPRWGTTSFMSSFSSPIGVCACFSKVLTSSTSVCSCWFTSISFSIDRISSVSVGACCNGFESQNPALLETVLFLCQSSQILPADIPIHPRCLFAYILRHPLRSSVHFLRYKVSDLYNAQFLAFYVISSNTVSVFVSYDSQEKSAAPSTVWNMSLIFIGLYLFTPLQFSCLSYLLGFQNNRAQVPPFIFRFHIFRLNYWRDISFFWLHTDAAPIPVDFSSTFIHGVAESKSSLSVSYRIMMQFLS